MHQLLEVAEYGKSGLTFFDPQDRWYKDVLVILIVQTFTDITWQPLQWGMTFRNICQLTQKINTSRSGLRYAGH